MPVELGMQFRERITAAEVRLRTIADDEADEEVRPGGWRRKEVLGHLIDSALNNHQRFVRAAIQGFYEGPSYEQNAWVDLHGYVELPWNKLLAQWWDRNDTLARVVERTPEARLAARCRVGDNAPVSLAFLIEDYLAHMDHHIAQIVRNAAK